jgi:hypothetical protein
MLQYKILATPFNTELWNVSLGFQRLDAVQFGTFNY